jgi:hypothetical protein
MRHEQGQHEIRRRAIYLEYPIAGKEDPMADSANAGDRPANRRVTLAYRRRQWRVTFVSTRQRW